MTEWEQLLSSAGQVKRYLDRLEREAEERNAQLEELRQRIALYEGHTLVSLTEPQLRVLLAILEAVSRPAASGVQVAVLSERMRREIEQALRVALMALQQHKKGAHS